MMQNRAKLLNEIAGLKEQLHKHSKAIARIEHWHSHVGQQGYFDEGLIDNRTVEKETLETVLRIFREEGGE